MLLVASCWCCTAFQQHLVMPSSRRRASQVPSKLGRNISPSLPLGHQIIEKKEMKSKRGERTAIRSSMNAISNQITRVSWLSWWSQVILTTVSTVILLFAKSVEKSYQSNGITPFILSSFGIILSGASIVWTWGNGARLSQRILRKPTSPVKAADMLQRAIRIGVTLNLVGLLLGLVAAEQIVGSLAVKVLTARQFGTGGVVSSSVEGLQPLDVLVVQANTNTLLSHFCSLVAFLLLTKQVGKLSNTKER